jgi:hypothetical protein
VLDFFEARCQGRRRDEQAGRDAASGSGVADLDIPAPCCASRGDTAVASWISAGRPRRDELAARLRFGETGDVHDVGDMRYVFVEYEHGDGRRRTSSRCGRTARSA